MFDLGDRVKCIEDLPFVETWYKQTYSKGTIKTGDVYEITKMPCPEKKLYKLEKVVNKFDDEGALYLRKSALKRYFEMIKGDNK